MRAERRMIQRTAQKGFTLVELAVVIAIVAILAAVAIPKLTNATDAAQRSVALDFVSQLNSASAMYTAKQMTTPDDFADFVTSAAIASGDEFTISTSTLGDGTCTVAASTVTCATAFDKLGAVTYTWTDGSITHNVPAL